MTSNAQRTEFVTVAGHRLAFTRTGHGPSVVLIHGIPTHKYLWRDVTPPLVAAGFEVIAFDMMGYGESDKPLGVDLGIAAQARMLARGLTELRWSGGMVVGHDIGGGVAQLMAVNDVDLVQRLVLVDTIAYDSFPEPGIARLKEPVWDEILGAPDFDLAKGFKKGLMRGITRSERVTPELVAAYERPFRGVEGRRAYLRAARALRTEELSSRMGAVERLSIPALIIWGADDPFQPLGYAERLAKSMVNARLVVVEGASHFLPEDEPATLADDIAGFAQLT